MKNLIEHMVWLLLLAALLAAGCTAAAADRPRDTFNALSEGEDGAVVRWSGYAAGYDPGGQAEVELGLANGTGAAWNGRYCLQLLDERTLVTSLAQQAFTLNPGGARVTPIGFRLPQALSPGAYGLALVVHKPAGPVVNTATIRVGDSTELFTMQQSAVAAALNACPLEP